METETKKNPLDRLLAIASLGLGAVLLVTDRWFTEVDDEVAIIGKAAKPIYETLRLYAKGIGEHEHPPLYDLLLHGWLRLTSGEMHLLRVPAIVFYVLGAFVLAKAGGRLGGRKAQISVFLLVALWPFGFHFGRLACWYSFSFLVVSLLTLAYLHYVEQRTFRSWLWVFLCALALVYTSYFGWVILACLAADFLLHSQPVSSRTFWPMAAMGAVLFVASLPLSATFLKEVHHGVKTGHSLLSTMFVGAYNLYCLFASESVAPWFWLLGVPVALAIAPCLVLVLFYGPRRANWFLVYFGTLLAVMTILGIVGTKRTLLIGAWLILPIGVAIGTLKQEFARRTVVRLLLIVAVIGWFGIFHRRWYAAPHWIEPWPAIAAEAATTVREGGVVIGNNPSFFFYLTYLLEAENPTGSHFQGFLPQMVQYPRVYNPEQWIQTGRPVGSLTLAVNGLNYPEPPGDIPEAMKWLDDHCRAVEEQHFARDAGARWKQRLLPGVPQPEWRIQVKRYTCP